MKCSAPDITWPSSLTTRQLTEYAGQHVGSTDSTNNVLALAFGLLVVTLIVAGSLWIMAHLNANMMPASAIMEMQR